MLVLYGAFQLSDAMQCTLVGILRGLQQVRSIAIISFIAYIVINIPVGYFVAFVLEMGAPGLIVGYIVGLSTAAILYGAQVARYLRYLRKIS
jgi:MATE family multidrug resistance protein